jgi:hypothetical protein
MEINDPKLQEIVRRIVDAVHPTRIYLFGSRTLVFAAGVLIGRA